MKNILCDTFININDNSIRNGMEIAKHFKDDINDEWRDQWGCLWNGSELYNELAHQTLNKILSDDNMSTLESVK